MLWRQVRRPRTFFPALGKRISEDRVTTLAAALAYYFFFALFPFLIFLLSLVTLTPAAKGIEDWLLGRAGQFVPGQAFEILETTIRSLLAQPRSGLLSLGAVLALWSASAAVASVMDALNVAYRVPERRPWWKLRLKAIGLTVGLSFFMILAFVLAVGTGPLVAWVSDILGPLSGIGLALVNWVVMLGAVTLVIATIYDQCPDVDLPFRWFSPGSVVFTAGFVTTTLAFSFYVGHFGSYDKTYGSLGAVIVLLLWMYLLALLLLLGGELDGLLLTESRREQGEDVPR
ncbi:MAG TPA: YihY/virulence factor BrkB family protein [Candidatus Binatia bacterium]|jgi:membrane protein|nr:YihY/virulence factor BrkB family protein [Candidatus Binatia bacterium]